MPIIVGSAAAGGLTIAIVVIVVILLFRRYTSTGKLSLLLIFGQTYCNESFNQID